MNQAPKDQRGRPSPARIILRGFTGAVVGFMIPFLLAQIYVARGGDPTAAGALSFLTLFTIPIGIVVGIAAGAGSKRK
jgi:hypothetical protein